MTSVLAQQDQALANFLPTPIEPVSAPQGRYIDPRLVWIGIPDAAIEQINADAQAVGMSKDQIALAINAQKAFPYWQFRNDIQKYAPINSSRYLRNLQLVELKIHLHKSNQQTGKNRKAFNATVRTVSDGFESREYIFKPSMYSMWSQGFLVSCLNLLDSDGGILQPFTLDTKKGKNDKTYFCSLYGSDFDRDKISQSSLDLGRKFKSFRSECKEQDEEWTYGQHQGLREAFLDAFDWVNEALADAYRTDDNEVVETTAEAA
jgi:hypothetical protein